MDNLVERSNALSAQSKMFYKTAKKVRSHAGDANHGHHEDVGDADAHSKIRAVLLCRSASLLVVVSSAFL